MNRIHIQPREQIPIVPRRQLPFHHRTQRNFLVAFNLYLRRCIPSFHIRRIALPPPRSRHIRPIRNLHLLPAHTSSRRKHHRQQNERPFHQTRPTPAHSTLNSRFSRVNCPNDRCAVAPTTITQLRPVQGAARCAPTCPSVSLDRPTVLRFFLNCRPTSPPNPLFSLLLYFIASLLRLPSLISSISPPNSAQTTPPFSTHSLSSLISAKLRTRIPSPGTPKISPSAPPHSPLYKVDESPLDRRGRSLPAHTTLLASSRHPLRPP
jgi:hypothetical protein